MNGHIYTSPLVIPKVMVKVMQIPAANILERVTARANIIISIKQDVLYSHLISMFTFGPSPLKVKALEAKDKDLAHFNCDYLGK